MKAVRWHAANDVRVEEVADLGDPPPGWVRLRVEACGICGTDLEEYREGPVVLRGTPLTLGHEAAGAVEAVGDGVDLRVGRRVAVEGNIVCGHCAWCVRGEWNLCANNVQLGLQADGGLATHLLAPASVCVAVADQVPAAHAAMAEPIAVAVRGVQLAGVAAGMTVAVVGGGTIGLLVAQVAKLAGAARVVVIEPHAQRRELATRLCADEVMEPGAKGEYDVVLESAGLAATAAAAIELTRRGGTTLLLGVFQGVIEAAMPAQLLGEKRLLTSMSHVLDPDFTTAVDYLNRGLLQLEPLITDRISLDQAVTHGLDALHSDPGAHLKVMVIP